MKTKVGTLRGNIVSILPSVVVDADIKVAYYSFSKT